MATIIFMGTPDFSVPTLNILIQHHDVIGVITQPDRPAGRGGDIKQSPIKQLALQHDIPVFQPKSMRKQPTIEALRQWQSDIPDFYIVAAFGQILPQEVLDIPKYGSINVHASLLPRWRGAAPIHAAIRAGDNETGVTIMQMDAGLDTGPMLSKRAIEIAPDETGQSLHDKLAVIGSELLIDTLPGVMSGEIQPEQQNDDLTTYAPQINKTDGLIDWSESAASIERMVRAFTPWPGTYTFWNDKQLKIHNGMVIEGKADAGKVIEHDDEIAVGTGDGLFVLKEVQLQGKKRVDITAFVNGYQDFVGSSLGNE